jgi:N-acetylglucosaminyldiphosphoundecaprenol N-acetyl-beta-D-mannosaminyltransferase
MFNTFKLYNGSLQELLPQKQLITTLNAHSFNTVRKDPVFYQALQGSDILLPDGISVVLGVRWLQGKKIKKIAGDDLFRYEMKRVHDKGGKCFFLGSTDYTLSLIKDRAIKEYPGIQVHTYSPPYKSKFSEEECLSMIDLINNVNPDVLFVGMTAPKQEKWAFEHFERINAIHVCCIGAVFDFYAGTVQRAPVWMITSGLEWFYRLVKEPKRMWKRYLIGNTLFVVEMVREKFNYLSQSPHLNVFPTDTYKVERN